MSESIITIFILSMVLVGLICVDLGYYIKFGNSFLHNDDKNGFESIGF